MKNFSQTPACTPSMYPYKSLAVAILLAVTLGPVGLLYASTFGGILMIIIGFVVVSSMLPVPIILVWLICCVWSTVATNRYNRKICRLMQL